MRPLRALLPLALTLAATAGCLTQSAPPTPTGGGTPYPSTSPVTPADAGGPDTATPGLTNPCGGSGPLSSLPGAACGVCDTGRWQCNGPDAVTCLGERRDAQNRCGGCTRLTADPGTACGEGGRWACNGRDAVLCAGGADGGVLPDGGRYDAGRGDAGPGRNACGGTGRLAKEPGDACGPCDLGSYECAGPEQVVCSNDGRSETDISDDGWAETSETYYGYDDDLALDGQRSTSWFSNGPTDDDTTFEWKNLVPRCFTSIEVLSNAYHADDWYRTGYGFERVEIKIKDFWGFSLWEESVDLRGTPDPDVSVAPGGVLGYSVKLTFYDHESWDRGGFSELVVREAQ